MGDDTGSRVGAPALVRAADVAAPLLDHPFTLGVASGDPTADGVVLWTRLAPEPLLPDGGMPFRTFAVDWQVATDEAFTDVVRTGTVGAHPELAHSVHPEVTGLLPDRAYFYRFRIGPHVSATGRTRTFPRPGTPVRSLRLATLSCQSLVAGRYAALRHLAGQDHDVVLHLGDYVYEARGPAEPVAGADRRHHPFRDVTTLEDYRMRHAQYHLDPDLQAAHAATPFLCVPDDHDVVGRMAGPLGRNGRDDPTLFRRRLAAAYRAYYEHLPLRRTALPRGPGMQLYRRFEYGDLASISLLDTRQHRSPQVDGPPFQPNGPEALDPARTMTGPAQERWLLDGLASSSRRWNVVGQQVYLAALDLGPGEEHAYNTDKWDGYPAARARLTGFLAEARPRNPVFLAGDSHAAMVNDITHGCDPAGPVVATELLGSSVSSAKGNTATFEAALPKNPQVRYYNGRQRGYLSCTVTPEQLRGDLWFVDDVLDAGSPVRLGASWAVHDGVLGAQPA
jgi:alkaline phosphatase D